MDQDPLPRGSSQVADRLAQVLDVVLELSKTTVAVETENATYITEYVIVIDVPRVWRAADRADAALRGGSSSNSCCPIRYHRRISWQYRQPAGTYAAAAPLSRTVLSTRSA
jgi:hypothetical protein